MTRIDGRYRTERPVCRRAIKNLGLYFGPVHLDGSREVFNKDGVCVSVTSGLRTQLRKQEQETLNGK